MEWILVLVVVANAPSSQPLASSMMNVAGFTSQANCDVAAQKLATAITGSKLDAGSELRKAKSSDVLVPATRWKGVAVAR